MRSVVWIAHEMCFRFSVLECVDDLVSWCNIIRLLFFLILKVRQSIAIVDFFLLKNYVHYKAKSNLKWW